MSADVQEYKYIMPHNSDEIGRLRNQHEWVKGSTGGKLIFVPFGKTGPPLKVMDSATADGFWCLDAARELPTGTSYVGFDIADHLFPLPEQVPAGLNLSLVKADVCGAFPSAWTGMFDLVHQRFMWASLTKPAAALNNLLACIKPGGWIQLVDVDMQAYPEGQHQPLAFSTLRALAQALLVDSTAAGKMEGWLRDAGMLDVNAIQTDVVAGAGHEKKDVGIKGTKNIRNVLESFMQAYTLNHDDKLGLQQSEWDALPKMIEKETQVHTLSVRIHIVWARKP